MKNVLYLLLISISFLLSSCNLNSTPTFSWNYDSCSHTGTYDSELYTQNQLQNFFDLTLYTYIPLIETKATVSNIDSIPTLNLQKLNEEYSRKRLYFDTVKVMDVAYVNYLKTALSNRLEEEYYFKKIAIEVYQNPQALLKYDKKCQEYSKVIASQNEDEIIDAARKMVEELKSDLYVEEHFEQFENKMNTPQRLEHAKLYLITYGWWGCVDEVINRSNLNENNMAYEAFYGFFTNVVTECDEP